MRTSEWQSSWSIDWQTNDECGTDRFQLKSLKFDKMWSNDDEKNELDLNIRTKLIQILLFCIRPIVCDDVTSTEII